MNKVILIGNLTRDPEKRTTQSGVDVCSFGLAVNRRRKTEGQPDVDFFNVTAWRQLGDLCARYLTKGRKVCVIGSVQIRTFDGNDGMKHTSVDVVADEVEFLSANTQSGDVRNGESASAAAATAGNPAGFTQVDEDELPF